MSFRLPTGPIRENLDILDRLRQEEYTRKKEDAIEESEAKADPWNLAGKAAGAASISNKIINMYDTLQEKLITKSGAPNKQVMVDINGVKTKINAFVPTAVEKTGNPVIDNLTALTSPSDKRYKLNPELYDFLKEEKAYDMATGEVLGTGHSTTTEIYEILNDLGYETETLVGNVSQPKSIQTVFKESSELPNMKFEDTIISDTADNIKTYIKEDLPSKIRNIKIGDRTKTQVSGPGAGNKITVPVTLGETADWLTSGDFGLQGKLAAYNPLDAGKVAGSKALGVAGKTAGVLGAAYGAYRVAEEEDVEEKIHGAIQALTPYLLATGNPLAIGLVGVNTIWDMLD